MPSVPYPSSSTFLPSLLFPEFPRHICISRPVISSASSSPFSLVEHEEQVGWWAGEHGHGRGAGGMGIAEGTEMMPHLISFRRRVVAAAAAEN